IGGAIDTDASTMCKTALQSGGPDVCMISGSNLTVSTPIRATGSRPLVLVAVQDLNVNALIDISGVSGQLAAGANTGACVGTSPGGDSDSSPGGGGGGSLGTPSGGGAAGSF